MKKIFAKCFVLLLSLVLFISITKAEVIYYPMDNGVEIEVPGYHYYVVYNAWYNCIYQADYNAYPEHFHIATAMAATICDTNDEYIAVVNSIDPNYFYGPIYPYPEPTPNF